MNQSQPLDQEKLRWKLEGALEMAGATANEIDRPLMTLYSLVESLLNDENVKGPRRACLQQIFEQIFQISQITKRINSVWKYETKKTNSGSHVIDLERSVAPCVEKDRICYGGEYWKLPREMQEKLHHM
ncbi:MAG: hypothetical protein HY788_04745 [Deltaproteobacteria bacterium]|nr:hypothetical protein [Deltaproteobacteria bacterium]